MQLQLTWQLLLTLPFLITGVIAGYRRGWREESITTGFLLAALLFFGNNRLAELMGILINRIVSAFALFFSAILGREVGARALVTDNNQTAFRFIGFLVLVVLAYVIGGVLGQRIGLTRMTRLVGSALGGINVFLVAAQLFGFLQNRLPAVFQREGTILIAPDSDATSLRNLLPAIFALLLVLLLIIVFLRLPKIRQ